LAPDKTELCHDIQGRAMSNLFKIAILLLTFFTHATEKPVHLKTVEELTQENSSYSNLMLGLYNEFGYSIPQNFEKAKFHYEISAHPMSFDRLGFLYNSGYGVEVDLKKANSLYMVAIDFHPDLVPEYIEILKETKSHNVEAEWVYLSYTQDDETWDCDYAINRFEELAKSNNVWVLYQLGHAYSSNSGVKCRKPDDKKAKQFYEKAANLGHPQSMNNLSVILTKLKENPLSSKEDSQVDSLYWLKKAAVTGVIKSQINLGLKYLYGATYLEKDIEKSLYWLSEARNQGSSWSKFYLGIAYLRVLKDKEKGLEFMKEASGEDICRADYELSRYYLDNQTNVKEAKAYFDASQKNGCKDPNNLESRLLKLVNK